MESNNVKENKLTAVYTAKNGKQISLKHKAETGKLREMLREKCRIRMKEARERCFNESRTFPGVEKDWVVQILEHELRDLDEDISLETAVYEGLVEEAYQWLLQLNEMETNYYASTEQPPLLCMICKKNPLTLESNLLKCNCGFRTPYQGAMEQLRQHTDFAVSQHDTNCNKLLEFYVEPNSLGGQRLNAVCNACDREWTIIQ